jgi:gas vesicle protein GvpO
MAQKTSEEKDSLTAKPFEEMDAAARGQAGRRNSGLEALKRAAMTAAAGALAAGLAGATKAFLDRRRSQAEDETEEQAEEAEEQETRPAEPDPLDQMPGGVEDEEEEEEEQEGGQPESPWGDPEEGPEQAGQDGQELRGSETGEAAQIVSRARSELESLLGSRPESVSGFEHADGRWSVTLEVVDVRRIPESTDVLSSYEVVLDEERNLVSATRLRRYRRSQVEEGG